MIKKLYLLLVLFVLPFFSIAQNMTIHGNVQDTVNGQSKPLKNAVAMLVRISDSVMVDFRRTDANGDFNFTNLKIDTLELIVSHPNLSENSYYIIGSKTNYEFDIRKIIIAPKTQLVKEVVIYAYKEAVFYRGDTLVYVADSFQTKPNAVVEDLLKKLPGIKVNKDGSLQAQGKDIQQVLVDGDEFFGADPTMATRNLGAKGVETVQIYEKKDENATDDSETIQVLDLKLKDEAKRGYFGKISGASDFSLSKELKNSSASNTLFYEGEMLANKFNKTQKISVFTLASNTMKSSLEWKDMYKYGLTSRNFFDEENDNWSWNTGNSGSNGIPQTIKTGVYYNDKISAKTDLNVNYTYNNSGLKTKSSNFSQYFLTDTSYVSDLNSSSEDQNQSHTVNFKLTQKLDSLTTMEIETNAGLNYSSANALDSTDFITQDNLFARNTKVLNTNEASGSNLTSKIVLRKNFMKKNRKLTAFYRFAYENNSSDGNLLIADTNYFSTGNSYRTDQSKNNSSLSRSHTGNISYIEPLTLKLKLELEYELYTNFNDQAKLTNNFKNGSYSDLDSNYSNSFQTKKLQNKMGAQLIYEHKKHRLSGGVRFRNIIVDNENFFLNTTIHQDFSNFLPRARYVYKMSQHNRFTLNYNTNSSQPTINQLQPVQDNTNPNRLVTGNPNLKPNYVHSFSASYNFYKALSGTHFWSSMNHSITNNAFGNATTFDNFGGTKTQTVNVDGNTNSSLSLGGGFPIFKKLIEVFPNVNLGHSSTKSFINTAENITINKSIGGGLEFKIEKDSVEFSIGGNYSYNAPTSSISSFSNLPFSSQNYSSEFLWKLPKGFFIETDATYTINSKRSAGYNINYLIWNASISKSFLKKENLIATIHCYDILNQNTSANRFINANVVTDTQSAIIARYLMARLTYKFNSNKTKEADDFF